jgi:hypothetical protein
MVAELEQQQDVPGEIFSATALFPRDDSIMDMPPLLAYKATADPDTLYLHEAMRQADRQKFLEAMTKEIEQQVSMGVYSILKRTQVPEGATILPAVWQLRRKRDQ